jgi:NAD(P)-dependent dehydrogenase (short-subunit alcohol dehydrogenase family)
MLMELTGQVALVTGAAKGIGAACAEALSAEGAAVVVADIDVKGAEAVAEGLTARGRQALAMLVDMGDTDSVPAMVDAAARWRGRLDVLVNNAGMGIAKPLLDYTSADWDLQLAVNLRGPFLALQAAARLMVARGGGRIVNIASTAAFVSSSTPEAAYDVSKAGVRQLTVSAAAELAGRGVHVNAVAPGTIATALTESVLDTAEKRDRASAKIPAGRVGRPEDIANAVVYLSSPRADYVHGHVLVVDGGWLLL